MRTTRTAATLALTGAIASLSGCATIAGQARKNAERTRAPYQTPTLAALGGARNADSFTVARSDPRLLYGGDGVGMMLFADQFDARYHDDLGDHRFADIAERPDRIIITTTSVPVD